MDGRIRGPTADGEVVAADHDPTAFDAADADHAVGRREARQLTVLVSREPRQGAVLLEAVAVEESVDPLANGQPAGRVLASDAVGPAHLPSQLLSPAQLFQFRLPAHNQGLSRLHEEALDVWQQGEVERVEHSVERDDRDQVPRPQEDDREREAEGTLDYEAERDGDRDGRAVEVRDVGY